MVALFAIGKSKSKADQQHPYGYFRFETVATLGIAILLAVTAFGIVFAAVDRLLSDQPITAPSVFTLYIAGTVIVLKESLYQYASRVGKKYASKLILAAAWHHRSDVMSSIIVFVGIGGAIWGLTWFDSLAAVGVALFIGKIGWNIGSESIEELVDTGLDKEELEKIHLLAKSVDGVHSIHLLKTRYIGNSVLVEMHLQVSNTISVSEGHMIGEFVREKLMTDFPKIAEITVHVDPEDDEIYPVNTELPLRRELIHILEEEIAKFSDVPIQRSYTFHYIQNRLQIEIFFIGSLSSTVSARIEDAVLNNVQLAKVIAGVKLFQRV